MGRLSYSMPAATDLVPGTTMDSFKAFDEVAMTADIDNPDTGNTLACANGAKCAVRYSWAYTPTWYHLSPSVLYPG